MFLVLCDHEPQGQKESHPAQITLVLGPQILPQLLPELPAVGSYMEV